MTSDIVSVEIGRSTWQGPAEEAPWRADNRDADMAECAAFSAGYEAGERDGRASGQQVRAAWLAGRDAAASIAESDTDWSAFRKANIEPWDTGPDAIRDYRLGIATGGVIAAQIRRMEPPAALTPAPQPEGQSHRSFPDAADGRPMPPMGEDLMAAGLSGEDARFVALQLAQNGLMLVPATPTAQEAVAWRCKDYADGWVLYGNKRQAECYQRLTGCLMEALYTHPPQPSETVADVHQRDLTRPIIGIENRTAQEVFDIMSDRIRAALRALKGGAHG
ncbi:hypothetical protein [Paracoccus sp. pheM1]|uniref:hypothetical protein n=1 Tax=Paracoccus sp. pheM1 TaxID=2831675 RepID=UPI001BDB7BF0|nr:hypothetical protein [Paracoccus sp. pheM1]MBT0778028.1 hypothetical protein [Paracoccus sp. pheM1]